MNDQVDILALLKRVSLVAVVRSARVADPAGLAALALAHDAPVLEFTLTTANALEAARVAAAHGAVVGVGTVLTRADAERALAAGARFLVSPVAVEEVIDVARNAGVPVFPGAFTPSEVHRAALLGAAAVKVFPARLGGPAYLRELRVVFRDIPLLPSGGVDAGNARAYLDVGALAVSTGTGVLTPALLERGDNAGLAARLSELRAALAIERDA